MPTKRGTTFANRRMMQARFIRFSKEDSAADFFQSITDQLAETDTSPKDCIPIWIKAMHEHLKHQVDFDYVFSQTLNMIRYQTQDYNSNYVVGFAQHFDDNSILFGKPETAAVVVEEVEAVKEVEAVEETTSVASDQIDENSGIPEGLIEEFEAFKAKDAGELDKETLNLLTMAELRQIIKDENIDLEGKRKKTEIIEKISIYFGIDL